MNLRETLTQVADRLQIAFLIGSVPLDESGDVVILHANSAAAGSLATQDRPLCAVSTFAR